MGVKSTKLLLKGFVFIRLNLQFGHVIKQAEFCIGL